MRQPRSQDVVNIARPSIIFHLPLNKLKACERPKRLWAMFYAYEKDYSTANSMPSLAC